MLLARITLSHQLIDVEVHLVPEHLAPQLIDHHLLPQLLLIFANSLSIGMSASSVPSSICAIIVTYSGSAIAAIANFSTHGSSVSTSLLHAILLTVL